MQEQDHREAVSAERGGDADHGKGGSERGFYPERRSFDRLFVPFSARCLNAPLDQLDREIEQGLHEVNSFFGGDRIILWEFAEDGREAVITHSHAEAGASPPSSALLHETLPYIFSNVRGLKNLSVSRLEDLPPDALVDRQYLERSGIQSFLVIPLIVGGSIRGALSLACTRTERVWSNEDLFRFQRIGSVLSGALDRKHSHQALEKRMLFETLITDLSARFVNIASDQVDREIERALEQVREFFQVDRCALLGIFSDRKRVYVTHASYGDGIERVSGDIDLATPFPWTYERVVVQGQPVRISRVEELPESAVQDRMNRIAMGIKSYMNIPVSFEGRTSSLIVLNAMREERSWPEEFVPRLRLLGEILVSALERRKTDVALGENEGQLQAQLREIEQLKQKIEKENLYLREEASLFFEHGDIVSQSAAMKTVLARAEQVARTDSTVLITGETGSGKELLAREIHNLSSRNERLLVTVNCASLPPTLIESELFGREKGAYTGAMTRMAGRFEVADGSTIFLDEIAELPHDLQSKLLRVIEEGTFERLGSTRTIHVNVRIIAATNRDLSQEVQRGAFRRDLFYRLNVFPITVPPLRDRAEDLPPLVWTFVRQFEKKMGKQIENIPKRSMEALQRYSWPGNIRELRNVIEHAMIMTRGKTLDVVTPVAPRIGQPANDNNDLALESVERRHILTALQKCGWRIHGAGGAAEALGLKRTTLQSKMKKLGIERPTN
jgi:formate hydrogenlyase transcriptional activator